MMISEALRAATERLAATSDTARLDAEVLMAHALGVSRSDLLLRKTSEPEPEAFAELIDRRTACEPVAYITGVQEFYGREFQVTPDVLIPRADSETVIEAALAQKRDAKRVLDLGVGSGALLLTFLAETDAEGIGIDQSAAAIAVAAENARRLEVSGRVDLRIADWNSAGWSDDLGQFDLILANPPYVETNAILDPDVREFEPNSALFAGTDGLDDYKTIIPQLRGLLTTVGKVVLEIGAEQAKAVSEIAAVEDFTTEIYRDLASRPRALVLDSV